MKKLFRRSLLGLVLAALTSCVQPPPAQPVRPLTPLPISAGGPSTAAIQEFVEKAVVDHSGPGALRQAQVATSSILVVRSMGNFGSKQLAVGVLTHVGGSWHRSSERVPQSVAREIDQIIQNSAFWREPAFYPPMDCPDSGATMMIVRHAGRMRVTRQSCAPSGLIGRLGSVSLGTGDLGALPGIDQGRLASSSPAITTAGASAARLDG